MLISILCLCHIHKHVMGQSKSHGCIKRIRIGLSICPQWKGERVNICWTINQLFFHVFVWVSVFHVRGFLKMLWALLGLLIPKSEAQKAQLRSFMGMAWTCWLVNNVEWSGWAVPLGTTSSISGSCSLSSSVSKRWIFQYPTGEGQPWLSAIWASSGRWEPRISLL